jgi:hypothetical protein
LKDKIDAVNVTGLRQKMPCYRNCRYLRCHFACRVVHSTVWYTVSSPTNTFGILFSRSMAIPGRRLPRSENIHQSYSGIRHHSLTNLENPVMRFQLTHRQTMKWNTHSATKIFKDEEQSIYQAPAIKKKQTISLSIVIIGCGAFG